MPPNHYLSVAIDSLFRQRSAWSVDTAVGKTVVGTSLIDRVAATLERKLWEVPDGSLGFGGEESAGAAFLRRDGTAWATEAPATAAQKAQLAALTPAPIGARELAGETITAVLDHAPGNGAAVGGIKVIAKNGWFAARPSGTEHLYKIYADPGIAAP